jgi:16S rRNA (adenine1518-N6/adenine1519-N6)-dimethyltransferase
MKRKTIATSASTGQRPKRSLGQNFLVDTSYIDRIIAAFSPRDDDVVVEIGPGRGALTGRLAERVGKLYALEFDSQLSPLLREKFREKHNLTVIEADAMTFDFATLAQGEQRLRLIANLPYNISTAVLQRLVAFHGLFSDCVLMFQKEVAERIMSQPGTKERGFLTVLTEAYFDSENLFDVPPAAFRPVPKIWSSVVRLTVKPTPPVSPYFIGIVSTAFRQKRKTISNNLKTAYPSSPEALEMSGIDLQRRAETLTLDEWLRLSEAIRATEKTP